MEKADVLYLSRSTDQIHPAMDQILQDPMIE